MTNLFETEEEAIRWVKEITPFAIKPKKKAKTFFINPFTSNNAFEIVTSCIGKSIYQLQENKQKSGNG